MKKLLLIVTLLFTQCLPALDKAESFLTKMEKNFEILVKVLETDGNTAIILKLYGPNDPQILMAAVLEKFAFEYVKQNPSALNFTKDEQSIIDKQANIFSKLAQTNGFKLSLKDAKVVAALSHSLLFTIHKNQDHIFVMNVLDYALKQINK